MVGAIVRAQPGSTSNGTSAPPIAPNSTIPTIANAFACCAVRHTAVAATPSSTRQIENTSTSGTSASTSPRMWRPNTTTPAARMTTNCATAMTTRGSPLPTTISNDVAGLARSRSHVPHPYSEKNANVMSDTTKNALIAACPGTTCSAPFAVRVPGLDERGRNAGFRNAIVMTGKTISTITGSGSRRARRISWRATTPKATRRDHATGSVVRPSFACRRVVVETAGDREEHGLQAGSHDLDPNGASRVRPESRQQRGRDARGIVGGDAHRSRRRRPRRSRRATAGTCPSNVSSRAADAVGGDELGRRRPTRRCDRGR